MQDEWVFRVVLPALMLAFVAHRGYYTRAASRPAGDTLKQRETGMAQRVSGILSLAALLATVVWTVAPRWVAWAAMPLPTWLRWTGVAVAIAGFALLQWAQVTLGRNWSDTPRLLRDQALVTAGPYHWVRHPIYTAFLLILGSTLLISANWLVGGLWIASTALDVASRVRYEEALLEAQFGASYREYASRTGRLWPRIARQ